MYLCSAEQNDHSEAISQSVAVNSSVVLCLDLTFIVLCIACHTLLQVLVFFSLLSCDCGKRSTGKSGVGVQMSPWEPFVPINSLCGLLFGVEDTSPGYLVKLN